MTTLLEMRDRLVKLVERVGEAAAAKAVCTISDSRSGEVDELDGPSDELVAVTGKEESGEIIDMSPGTATARFYHG